MKLLILIKEYVRHAPKIKKIFGIILVLIGLVALITPFTPGAWFIFIGIELLGFRIFVSGAFRRRLSKASALKFWKRK